MQTKFMSMWESIANTVVGLLIAWVVAMVVFPLYGYPISAGHAFSINIIFYIASFARSFILRRLFNAHS